MTVPDTSKQAANPTAVLLVGAAIFALTVAAYLYCEVNKLNSGLLVTLAGPVIAALLIANRVDSLSARTNKQLAGVAAEVQTVKQQTNGQLTDRLETIHGALEDRLPAMVEEVVRRVLTERDTTATAAVAAGAPAPAVLPAGAVLADAPSAG